MWTFATVCVDLHVRMCEPTRTYVFSGAFKAIQTAIEREFFTLKFLDKRTTARRLTKTFICMIAKAFPYPVHSLFYRSHLTLHLSKRRNSQKQRKATNPMSTLRPCDRWETKKESGNALSAPPLSYDINNQTINCFPDEVYAL